MSTVATRIRVERVVFAGFLSMFAAAAPTWFLSQLWAPLIWTFWVFWPLAFWFFLTRLTIRTYLCGECLQRARTGATRCHRCGGRDIN